MSDQTRRISTETALRLLVKQPRRRVLRLLADAPGGTTVDQLRAKLSDGRPRTLNESAPDDRTVELHHTHLPMLEAASVVVYDASRGTVQRGSAFADVLELLEAVEDYCEEPSASR